MDAFDQPDLSVQLAAYPGPGWLSLFITVTTVSQIAVLPVLCMALLPVWLLVTDRPELRIVEPTPPPAAVPGD